jgi:hypothetical protein
MKLPFKTSIKHVQIDKARNTMLIVVGVASFITAFSLLSAKTLLGQSSYQHKVLKEKNKAVKQLKDDIGAANALKNQYDVFEKANPNIIGGVGGESIAAAIGAGSSGDQNTVTNNGQPIVLGPQDGDNAKVVLDALPSQYDFPALTSSLEKIVTNDHVGVQGISGTDAGSDSAQPPTGATGAAPAPGPQSQASPIPFSVSAQTDYNTGLNLIKDFERSIRPFDITSLTINGSANTMNLSIQANTYYQPSVGLQITEKEIK